MPYTTRGHAYLNKGEYGPAIADYSEAIRLDPKDASTLETRGIANYNSGNYGAAASDLDQSAQKTPKNAYPALWLYLARSRSGSDNAGEELAINSATLKQSDWPFPVVELFLGRRTSEATLAASEKPDERCEAQFYIGEWHLLHADHSAAREPLQAAANTCSRKVL